MSCKGLKRHLPDASTLRRKLHHQIGGAERDPNVLRRWVRDTIAQPMVWHLNRRSVAGGVAVGLFVSWVPLPMQMLLAAVLAAVLRVHVPVSVVMVWFTNPLTVALTVCCRKKCRNLVGSRCPRSKIAVCQCV